VLPASTHILNKSGMKKYCMCILESGLLVSLMIGSTVALVLTGVVFLKRNNKPIKLEVEEK